MYVVWKITHLITKALYVPYSKVSFISKFKQKTNGNIFNWHKNFQRYGTYMVDKNV